eukprot:CAMPEP_0206290282 /NCGR_PEP_ID=MMETSP0106_2-20121207/2541_1 /ASSEMBLY_ACC=CAM_ASM_000206 /TAXON_ID=81532 /ORGANISM="Acanthoeca-like sp., Strain 10tr" /LENGTH=522 /DNA_ID=CAMNT_0053720841 /DNA_START=68 /DNA_END=1636 /DNA_ORIENTATION=-
MDEAVQNFVGITGLPVEQATMYIEMAGGNLETAVSLFFDNAGGGAAAAEAGDGGRPAPADWAPAHTLLFGVSAVPASWADQGFEFGESEESRLCILQKKNGPCGILAAVNAELVLQMGLPEPSTVVTDDDLAAVLCAILLRCARGDTVCVAKWDDGGSEGGAVAPLEIPADEGSVRAAIVENIAAYRACGGCVLLCHSVVCTRGIDAVKADVMADGGELPLVYGPHSLCSSELVNLFVEGVCRGNVAAYDPSGVKSQWRTDKRSGVGLLSRMELESGVPLADELKSPRAPVFLLHGGDHFTFMWAGGDAADGSVTWTHWNGLPPNRRLSTFTLSPCSLEPLEPAAESYKPTHWRPVIGELESVVQAHRDDKAAKPGQWRNWRYELALVNDVVLAEDSSPERPPDVPKPLTYDLGDPPAGKWRCGSCYQTRFKTMCFGDNEPSDACVHCGRPKVEAGWTIWRDYSDLPPGVRARVDRNFGPKVLSVLRTRWGGADLVAHGAGGKSAVAGSADFDNTITPIPSV